MPVKTNFDNSVSQFAFAPLTIRLIKSVNRTSVLIGLILRGRPLTFYRKRNEPTAEPREIPC